MSDRWDQTGLKTRVDGVLRSFLDEEAAHLAAVDAALAPVADQLRKAAGHGKRLRAAFCYWGWRAAGQPESDALVRAAASMELVHAAAVVHDDLIDDSRLRHGLPTAHVALEAVLARDGRPDARTAARSLAMLVGDQLMVLAGLLFTTSGLPAAYLARARDLWAVLARELVAGECLEILHTGGPPDTGTSLKVVRYKTAKYTVEHPLLIGGLLAGAAPRCGTPTGPTHCRSARPSSCATTCSACSGTRNGPGRRVWTTCAPTGPPHCWPRPGRPPTRPNGSGCAACWAATTWTRPTCTTCAGSCGS